MEISLFPTPYEQLFAFGVISRETQTLVGMPVTVKPTAPDVLIARAIARRTNPTTEEISSVLTWGADEHVLFVFAGAWWLWSRGQSVAQQRTLTIYF